MLVKTHLLRHLMYGCEIYANCNFNDKCKLVDDLERSGRASTSTDDQHVNKVKEFVPKNRPLTVKDLADMIEISEGSVKSILKDHLVLRKVKSRLVLKTLNFWEKSRRVDVCETMLSD